MNCSSSTHEQWAALFRSGLTQKEIALRFGVTAQAVGKAIRRLGVSRIEGGKSELARRYTSPRKPAHIEWIRRFEAGETMTSVADSSGVSLTAVEKVLRRFGADFDRHEESLFERTNGVSVSRFGSISAAKRALEKFQVQRMRAKNRGVGWEMTFPEWWSIWESSGRWEERGIRMGSYVMARTGDVGPYAVWNVRIDTARNNLSESRFIRMNLSNERSGG